MIAPEAFTALVRIQMAHVPAEGADRPDEGLHLELLPHQREGGLLLALAPAENIVRAGGRWLLANGRDLSSLGAAALTASLAYTTYSMAEQIPENCRALPDAPAVAAVGCALSMVGTVVLAACTTLSGYLAVRTRIRDERHARQAQAAAGLIV